jgi:signal peptidase I
MLRTLDDYEVSRISPEEVGTSLESHMQALEGIALPSIHAVRSLQGCAYRWLVMVRTTLIAFVLLAFATGCSDRRFRQGSSAMSPTIQSNEVVVADMEAYRSAGPQRWDAVVFHPPASTSVPQQFWVMRVIGLPGEILEIREDGVYVDGKRETQPDRLASICYSPGVAVALQSAVSYPYKIPAGAYFLAGDNTTNSLDSRFWGALPRQSILGRVKNK